MNKIILSLLLSVLIQSIYSQNINKYNKPTEDHILVKGTNINMIPPKDYIESANFKGFQNPNDQTSMIMIVEIPGPFNEISKGFNAEMLATQGMKLISKKETSINEFKGYIIDLEQDANGLTYAKNILIYGDDKSTTIINGVFLKNSKETEIIIKESINSAVIDNEVKVNPREALDYALDENIGSLVFVNVIGNGFLFNRDGKTPTQSDDKATLITDKSYGKTKITNNKLFCVSRLKKYPNEYQIIDKKGVNEIEIDGLKGYQLYAKKLNAENELLYQVILFQEDGDYYIFIGTYLEEKENAINDIQKIIMTFKRK